MNASEWRDFLREVSRVILEKDTSDTDDVNRPNFSQAVHDARFIGYEGASEEQIAAAEARLGVRFPPSYRTFLSVSNGFPALWHSVEPGDLWSAEQVRWARDQDPNLVEIFGEVHGEVSPEEHVLEREEEQGNGSFRAQYVQNLLSISDHGDACDLLLSPEVVGADGEWECWKISSWGGAERYRSFEAWLRDAIDFWKSQ